MTIEEMRAGVETEDYASRLVLEIGRRRYEVTRCGMLACSSCLPWDEMSAESRQAWANDWLAPHIRGAVAALAAPAPEPVGEVRVYGGARNEGKTARLAAQRAPAPGCGARPEWPEPGDPCCTLPAGHVGSDDPRERAHRSGDFQWVNAADYTASVPAPDADGAAGVRDAWSAVDAAIEAHASARHQATLVTGEVCPSPRRYSDDLLRTHSALLAAVRAYGEACGAAQARAAEALGDEVEVICRECGDHISGMIAGSRVRWVTCQTCSDLRARLAEAEGERATALDEMQAAWADRDIWRNEAEVAREKAAEAERRAAAAVEDAARLAEALALFADDEPCNEDRAWCHEHESDLPCRVAVLRMALADHAARAGGEGRDDG